MWGLYMICGRLVVRLTSHRPKEQGFKQYCSQGDDASVILLKQQIEPLPVQYPYWEWTVENKLFTPMPSTDGGGARATIHTGINNLFFPACRLLLNVC